MSEFFLLGSLVIGLFSFAVALLIIGLIQRHRIIIPLGALSLHAVITLGVFLTYVAITGGTGIGAQEQADISSVLESVYGISLILLFPHLIFHVFFVLVLVVKGISNINKRKNDISGDDDFMRQGL